MKKVFFINLICLVFIYGFVSIQQDAVDRKAITASSKLKLEPYEYDSQRFTKILSAKKAKLVEIEVPVFIGESYRVIFNTSALSKPIKISIYTKDKESNKRKPIFTNEGKENEKEIVFDSPKIRKLFIDYEVPKDSADQAVSGFVYFMTGYTFLKPKGYKVKEH